MTSCDYCERDADYSCALCGASCCHLDSRESREDGFIANLCNPDPAMWPGRGCYKPPVAEVDE